LAATQKVVAFQSSGGTDVGAEVVWATFKDEGLPAVELEAFTETFAREEMEEPRTITALPPAAVVEMLAAKEDWKLAIGVPSTPPSEETLSKADLKSAWDAGSGPVITVGLRPMTGSERLLLDSVSKLYAPDVSLDRLKEALALPVAQAGLIATGAGLFGLLALRDKIGHPDAMKLAVVLAALAVGVSLIGRYFLGEVTIKPRRLDLLRKRFEESIRGPLLRSRIGLVLLLGAILAALVATWPADGEQETRATIESPSTTGDRSGATIVHQRVTWENLEDTVEEVRTMVHAGGNVLKTSTSPRQTDGTAEQEFDVSLPSPTTIRVATEAVDEEGSQIGTGFSRTFNVP
jgi:hypothetical protein